MINWEKAPMEDLCMMKPPCDCAWDDFRAEIASAERTNDWERVSFWLMEKLQNRLRHRLIG